MRHRTTRTFTAAAALVAIAAATGCAQDGPDPADGSVDAVATSSSSPVSPPATSTTPPVEAPSAPVPPAAVPPAPAHGLAATPAPLIAAATWADSDFGSTLKIAPTPAGREAWEAPAAAEAWREVLQLAPEAGSPGMWEQFDCHWTWARILEPDKPTWNIEPWRPVAEADRMLAEGCNPGGPEV